MMNRVEMDENMMAQVNGGQYIPEEPSYKTERLGYYLHNGCGGVVTGVDSLFDDCYCDKCGKKTYRSKNMGVTFYSYADILDMGYENFVAMVTG